jgi:GntR family transcriptional regulator
LAGLFEGLTLERLKSSERSLYSLYESAFGVRMIRAEEHLRAVLADAPTAAVLEVEVGSPLLLVERVAYTYGNKPVEWRRGYYCTHEHHYFNELF